MRANTIFLTRKARCKVKVPANETQGNEQKSSYFSCEMFPVSFGVQCTLTVRARWPRRRAARRRADLCRRRNNTGCTRRVPTVRIIKWNIAVAQQHSRSAIGRRTLIESRPCRAVQLHAVPCRAAQCYFVPCRTPSASLRHGPSSAVIIESNNCCFASLT